MTGTNHGEAMPEQVVDVVAQAEVWVPQKLSADRPSVLDISAYDRLMSWREQGLITEDATGVLRLLRHNQVRVTPQSALR